jgi:hypothetical protein
MGVHHEQAQRSRKRDLLLGQQLFRAPVKLRGSLDTPWTAWWRLGHYL